MGVLVVGANDISLKICKLINDIENIDVTIIDSNRRRVQEARLDGLKALNTSIFSHVVVEDMQLGAYRYLFL